MDHGAHDRLLQAIADDTRAAVLERYSADSCIATTRAVIQVARYFGVAAGPWACRVKVFNELAWQLARDGTPLEQWPPEAWSISIDDRNPDPRNRLGVGHLVAVTATGRLIDASIDQASRPAKAIVLAPLVAMVPPGYDLAAVGGPELLYDCGGVQVVYGPSPSRAYTRSRNWDRTDPVMRATVGAAIRAVRARPGVSVPGYRGKAG